MTVSSSITTHSYIPAGAMLAESLAGVVFINASDLVVTDAAAAVQVLGTDYEITGNGRTGAASIRTLRVYGAGIVLTVTRVTESAQLANIQPNQPLPAEAVETELDRRALIEQEGRREIGVLNQRALKVPAGEVAPVMPTLAQRIGKFFTWGAAGEIIPASGTGADAGLRTDLALLNGAALIGLISGDRLQDIITGLTQSTAYASVYGVTTETTPAQNRLFMQNAATSGAKRVMIPAHTVISDGTVNYAANGQLFVGACPFLSNVKKADQNQGPLFYATGKDGVGMRDLRTDGSRSQTLNFGVSKWNVFYNNCTNVIINNCFSKKSLTDNIVVELCNGVLIINTQSHDSGKAGIYSSASENVFIINCDTNDNYSSDNSVVNMTGPLGTGIQMSNTWNFAIIMCRAKNNQLGQVTLSRGNKYFKMNGNILGHPLQTRGVAMIHALGERTSGMVHGVLYDGVQDVNGVYTAGTFYGSEKAQLSDNTGYLPDLLLVASEIDFYGHVIDALVGTHATSLGDVQKLRYHPGCRIATTGVGVGFAMDAFDGKPSPRLCTFDGIDFKIPSGLRIFDYNGLSTYSERRSSVDGVLVANGAVGNAGVTYVAPAVTYVAPAGGATVDANVRASQALLVADVAALRVAVAQLAADNADLRNTANGLAGRMRSQGDILT